MSAFWLTVLLLLIAACVLFLAAAWREHQGTAWDRNTLNKVFYQQRLQDLKQDEEQGVVAERAEMVRELQQNLLTDIPESSENVAKRPLSRWVLLPGVLAIVLISGGFYLKTGGLLQVMHWQQVQKDFPSLTARIMDPKAKQLTMSELADLGLGIRTELQKDPQNFNNWMILGRLGMVQNNAEQASQAFAQALKLQPENMDVKLSYAEVLSRSADPADNRQAEDMLDEMVKGDANNVRLRGLMAFNAFNQQQYDKAISNWQKMLTLLPAGDSRIAMIQQGIAQAKSNAGQQSSVLTVTINLASAAEKALPAGGVLFISVSDGSSPVPVAVKRLPLSRFPLTLTLDDSNAMMQSRLLSAQKHVQVRARISTDGTANPKSGDWFGQSQVMAFDGKQSVTVAIDQQQP